MFEKPFAIDTRRPREKPLHFDQQFRADRLQQLFSTEALPSQIDAIIIGSGIGGLATAAILAKTGRKVVVLEKCPTAGGCCKGFDRGGYEFDVGIHYVGQMGPNDFERFLLDQLTDGQLDWQKMDQDFDHLVFVKSPQEKTTIVIRENIDRVLDELIKRYPEHEKALREFYAKVPKAGFSTNAFYNCQLLKTLPVWLANFIVKTRLHKIYASDCTDFYETSTKQCLDKLFGEGASEMKAAVGYASIIFGVEPQRAAVGTCAFTYNCYQDGAYYPIGGASEIPHSIIPTIEKAGGRVLVNANVTKILLQGQKAIGVRVETNFGSVDVKAPLVISATGVSNTFRKLLPKEVVPKTKIGQLLESGRIKPSQAFFQVFIGLRGSQNELKLPAKNFWLIYDSDFDKSFDEWSNLDLESAVKKAKVPFLFVSFPSAKDPTYNDRFPGQSVCNIAMPSSIDWYRKWINYNGYSKSIDCEAAETELANKLWNLVTDAFPHLIDRKDYIGTGSPLWMRDVINAYDGEPYGLDHDRDRFVPEVGAALRPQVPEIADFYLTGQDVLACGFVACLYSAILTSQVILKQRGECSNLLEDVKGLFKKCANKKEQAPVNGIDGP